MTNLSPLEQQRTIEYHVEENQILKEQLKGRKLRLPDDQRRRLGQHPLHHDPEHAVAVVDPRTLDRWLQDRELMAKRNVL